MFAVRLDHEEVRTGIDHLGLAVDSRDDLLE